MSSGHLGMKWSLFIWDLDRCSNFGVWIVRFRHSTPLSVFVSSRRQSPSLLLPTAQLPQWRRYRRPHRSCSTGRRAVSLVLRMRQRNRFDQKLTSALCAVWWKECASDVSLHTHRYECIYHRYHLRHRPLCHHARWLVCDSSLTLYCLEMTT